MAHIELCKNDPLIEFIREKTKANPIMIPRKDIKPLDIFPVKDGKIIGGKRGSLLNILDEESKVHFSQKQFKHDKMPDLSGKHSSSFAFSFGLKLLDGLFEGFSIKNALPEINTQFKKVKEISFTFKEVENISFDLGSLGKKLKDTKIDKKNSAANIYFSENGYQLFLVTSIIVSRDFSINVTKWLKSDSKLDIQAIQDIILKLNPQLKVESSSQMEITLKNPEPLAFAFNCNWIEISSSGQIKGLYPDEEASLTYASGSMAENILLSEEPMLLDIEDE